MPIAYDGWNNISSNCFPHQFRIIFLLYGCGRQNSKMSPNFLVPDVHVLYNLLLLNMGGTCEYEGISFPRFGTDQWTLS